MTALADLVRPPEPIVVVDDLGIYDGRVFPGPIPWTSIRAIRRVGTRLHLTVEGFGRQVGFFAWLFRRSQGAVTISLHGLTCALHDVDEAIERGLGHKGRPA